MDYYKTLSNLELIELLEIESEFKDADMVKELLLSRQKKMTKQVQDLENSVNMYKGKCSELSNPLEEAEKKGIMADGKLEEFKEYERVNNELKEKVFRLEGECRVISEREKKAVEKVGSLSAEIEKIDRKRIEELAIYKGRWASVRQETEEERKKYKELEKMSELMIEKLETDLEVYKAKCSELHEKEENTRKFEGELEEFKRYKMVSNELQEKVTRLEQDCKVVIDREKRALENVAALSADLENMSRKRNLELGEFKRTLECEKQKVADEMRDEKKRYTEMVNKSNVALCKLKNDFEMQKWKCQELSREVEEKEKKNIELQSKIQELKEYETLSREFKDKVPGLEDAVSILENELEIQNRKCSELLLELEEKEKKNAEMQSKLEAYKKYEIMCEQFKDKVACLEENCKIVGERKKALIENNTALLAVLEKVRKGSDAQLTEIKTKNKDLECAKRKAEDELKDQMERIKELEKTKDILNEMETDLEMYKARCSYLLTKLEEEKQHSISMEVKLLEFEKCKTVCNELEEKVSCFEEDCNIASEREKRALDRITDLTGELEVISWANNEELNELREKNKDLECAKQKAENEVKAQNEKYNSLVPAKANFEAGAENKEGEMDKNKQGITENGTNEPLNAANSPKLKIELKDLSSLCDGEVRDHKSSVSICNSAAKSGLVPGASLKRKRKNTSLKCDWKKRPGQNSTCRRCGNPSHFVKDCPWYKTNTGELVPDRRRWNQRQLSGNTVALVEAVVANSSKAGAHQAEPLQARAAHGKKKQWSQNFQNFTCRNCGDVSHLIRDCPRYKGQNTGQLMPNLATAPVLPHSLSLIPTAYQAEPLQARAVPLPFPAPAIAAHGGGKQSGQNLFCMRCKDPSHFARNCPWYKTKAGHLVPSRRHRDQRQA